MNEPARDEPEPLASTLTSPETCDATPAETAGAKLFVIFFLAFVPLLGIAIAALVIYSLLAG